MLLKSFVALALIPELNFEIGMTALHSEFSDQSDESPYLITSIFLKSTWVRIIHRGRRMVEQFPISLCNQFKNAKNGRQKTNNAPRWQNTKKSQARLVELLKHYTNNNILKQLDGL